MPDCKSQNTLEIEPLESPPQAAIQLPGSKSITNRALILAALTSEGGYTELRGALRSEDTLVMIEALKQLGFHVQTDWENAAVHVAGTQGELIPATNADLFVGNSGTSMRFLTALCGLGNGRYRLDGVPRMRERPIEDLLAALRQLGVQAFSEKGNDCPPVLVEARGLRGGTVRIRGDISSQFLSGLLMVCPFATNEVAIEVVGPLVSWPYASMTVEMMRQWTLKVEADSCEQFRIACWQRTGLAQYDIEPDASAASYFWGAAAVTGGRIKVSRLTSHSLQGDVRFVDVLEEMGCHAVWADTGITVEGGPLRGIDVDMNDISDTVMTLAAVACFAEGPTRIRNVAHIRHKETDRLRALATELRRIGAEVEELPDGLTIMPRPLQGAVIETYNDHRIAMSMALIGLRVRGIVLRNPGCVAKTYPSFFQDLDRLRHTDL
jgi:3-phosphoshikimate 1-carboxyvinyltransferase